jgi:hypothetical protein
MRNAHNAVCAHRQTRQEQMIVATPDRESGTAIL